MLELDRFGPSPFLLIIFQLLLEISFTFLFAITAAGVVSCGGPETSPCASSIVQIIFSFLSFVISDDIFGNQKFMLSLDTYI